jgi:hypothetical protein
MARRMYVLGPQGTMSVSVVGSEDATVVAEHWNAVKRYLNTGDDSQLRRFQGVSIAEVELETDLDEIDRLASLGVLEFEHIYEQSQ